MITMAKKGHGRSRRRFDLRRVRITPELPLLTLASDTALVVATVPNSPNRYRAMSIKATWALRGLGASDGPITVGLAHSGYSVGQIKEAIEAASAIDQGDKIAQEQANRLVRIVGILSDTSDQLNDGQIISTKLNWLIGIGDAVVVFAYNEDVAALATGSVLNVAGDLWVKDQA